MSELQPPTDDRYAESATTQWAVVEDRFDSDEFWQGEETYAVVHKYPDGPYVLDLHTQVDKEVSIQFDNFWWSDGTLFFERQVGDKSLTSGTLDWHINAVGGPDGLGLVGEWFREQIDVSEYRIEGEECPNCGSSILGFDGWAACESIDCDAAWS